MDKKVVLDVEMEEYASLTPEEIFTKMLEGTGEDGVLTVKEMADAPQIILDNERNMLAESLAIQRFAEEEC